jgi:hypothetical protein
MKKKNILDFIFIIIGIIGFIELSFIRGLFTGTLVMILCAITGIISTIYSLVKKEYHIAILYLLLFATIIMGYINIM